mmetsp:Transcript_50994/g.83545  ORF Transcript_50994/g.83545 Transcript_50994/m.83545 type:complete len:312 (+) Transcript_50994:189-1124(+)
MLRVPLALLARPVKGKQSGDREHWVLILMRQTQCWRHDMTLTVSGASMFLVKTAACWPYGELFSHSMTSEASDQHAMGTTGPNCSSLQSRMVEVTGYTTAGYMRYPLVLPPLEFRMRAPFALASSSSSCMYVVLLFSGRGVMLTPDCHGSPACNCSTAAANFLQNCSAMLWCTNIILSAVQRWPLYDVEPVTHSFTAMSRSASGITIPAFLASRPRHTRSLCGDGWFLMRESAAREPPMNAKMSIIPDSMMGGSVARPLPVTKLTTPLGNVSLNASMVRRCASPPVRGIFMTTVLPIISEGMNWQYVSLNG